MITQVVDERGNLLHDCGELGCAVSWDGFVIDPEKYRTQLQEAEYPDAETGTFQRGDAAIGRQEVDETVWDLQGEWARLKRASG